MPSVDLRRRGTRVWGRGFGWCRECGACQRGNVKEVSTKSTSHQTLIAAKLSTAIRLWGRTPTRLSARTSATADSAGGLVDLKRREMPVKRPIAGVCPQSVR